MNTSLLADICLCLHKWKCPESRQLELKLSALLQMRQVSDEAVLAYKVRNLALNLYHMNDLR